MLNIPIILGSVREGRKSEAPAKYILEKVKAAGYKHRFWLILKKCRCLFMTLLRYRWFILKAIS